MPGTAPKSYSLDHAPPTFMKIGLKLTDKETNWQKGNENIHSSVEAVGKLSYVEIILLTLSG